MMNTKNRIDVTFGQGESSLFLAPVNGEFELLDYEFDAERIHEIGGGYQYYQSCSGCSGAGYLTHYGELIPVGLYRVDTHFNDFQEPIEVAEGIEIMLPYASHESDKQSILENNPVVIRVGNNTLIYCGFYTTMNGILSTLLNGEEIEEKPSIFKRKFFHMYWKEEIEVKINFYNLFGERSFYPWEFATELLQPYRVNESEERVHQIFHVVKHEDGEWVKTCRIGGTLYAMEELKGDSCLRMEEAPKGWELAGTNLLYKLRKDDVYIVGWQLAESAYQKKALRLAKFMPAAEERDFTNFIEDNCPDVEYVEFELTVPKLLFFLDKEKQFAKVRKGIAKKVTKDVLAVARQFMDNFNDQQVLEAIPDNLVIKFKDSLDAGNCQPGTQEFVNQYFPGKMEITAGELKKYSSSNWNVMRIFRYIALRDKIAGKIKLEIPV